MSERDLPSASDGTRPTRLLLGWLTAALAYAWLTALLLAFSDRFDNDNELADMPALALAGGLVAGGVVYGLVFALIAPSLRLGQHAGRVLLFAIVGFGLALRIALSFSTPAIEDDYFRYLWDGAVVAQGLNPYAYAPEQADDAGTPDALTALAEDDAGANVRSRINHASLKTIYPPTAQAAFLLAYVIEPWSLGAWRIVCLAADVVTLTLLLALLAHLGRPALWVSLYWLNPVVLKELFNSAHMEAIVIPPVLAAVLLALRDRQRMAALLLGIAVGAKLWPLILAPIVFRRLIGQTRLLFEVAVIFAIACALAALPALLGGLDETSGFVAYATHWQTNSALLPALEAGWRALLVPFGGEASSGRLSRALLGLLLAAIVTRLAWRPVRSDMDMTARLALALMALVLLSPAQFPWYLAWAAWLLPVHPSAALLVATVTMPVYYASFYFHANGTYWIFRDIVVWAIWLPVWLTIILETNAAKPAWREFTDFGRRIFARRRPPP